jgi:hypothetical protein
MVTSALLRFSSRSVTLISSESRRLTLSKARNLWSRQIRNGKTIVVGRLVGCTGRDAEIAKTDRKVLVTTSTFEMMLCPYETIGPAEPMVIGGHSLRTIVKLSALNTVEDIEVSSIVLRDRTTRPIARYWRNDAEREK